jgi:type I restriction enzyme M protein
LKRNFQASKERIQLLDNEPAFVKLNTEKNSKNNSTQNDIKKCLENLGNKVYKDYELFSKDLKTSLSETGINISSSLQKVIENTLSERDDGAIPQVDSKGELVADSTLRDSENISLTDNIDEYFKNEVIKYVPDAWIDEKTRDKIGYEIPFTRHFYVYKPLRSLEEIDKDLKENQKEISNLQNEVIGK